MFWTPGGGGGVHRVLSRKSAFFRQTGWKHTLLAPGASGPDTLDSGGWTLPLSGGYRFVTDLKRASRLIQAVRPDIIEAADPYVLAWSVLDAARRLNIPTVAFCHSHLPRLMSRLASGRGGQAGFRAHAAQTLATRYLRDLYQRYDMVLAPSRYMAQELQACGIAALHQPLGVDCAVFNPSAHDSSWRYHLEKQLELRSGTQLLLYVGRFAWEKNLNVLVEAVTRLGPGHALLAVGSGPHPPRGEFVRVIAPERDPARIARLMASSDVFVHAGDQETFGLATLEAMACGTPVVVSARAGSGELAAGAGMTVGSNSASDWADAMRNALDDVSSSLPWLALERARSREWNKVLSLLARRYQHAMGRERIGLPVPADPHSAIPTASSRRVMPSTTHPGKGNSDGSGHDPAQR